MFLLKYLDIESSLSLSFLLSRPPFECAQLDELPLECPLPVRSKAVVDEEGIEELKVIEQ